MRAAATLGALLLHARATLLALVRRRLTLVLLSVLPVALFLTQEAVGRSTRALLFGVSWAVGTVAYFTTSAAHQLEPRLRLAGRSAGLLTAARLTALVVMAMVLSSAYLALVLAVHPVRSPAALAVDFAVTAVLAVAFGSTVASLVAREMEGTLLLFVFAALQAVADPFGTLAKVLPFWASRELGTWAIDGPEHGSLASGLAHAALVLIVCAAVSLLAGQISAARTGSR